MSRPAPITSITANATSATTRPRRTCRRTPPLAPLVPACVSATAKPFTPMCRSCASPKSMLVAIATPQVNSSTGRSTLNSVDRGRAVGYACVSVCRPTRASHNASALPAIDSSAPSMINCRRRRPRLAPRAVRTANSRRRIAARASERFAKLAQAISRTNPAVA